VAKLLLSDKMAFIVVTWVSTFLTLKKRLNWQLFFAVKLKASRWVNSGHGGFLLGHQ